MREKERQTNTPHAQENDGGDHGDWDGGLGQEHRHGPVDAVHTEDHQDLGKASEGVGE